ncbi:MAG: alpha/beta fold hydrolase [Cyclobacteriaceae bacterium]
MIDQNLTRLEGVISGSDKKPITYDMKWNRDKAVESLVLFVHGFKGFKDWGIWNRVGDFFANSGVLFLKINLSHNGTTPSAPGDFGDLTAFGNNNFTLEVEDIHRTLEAIATRTIAVPSDNFDLDITIIGHSRGGASAIVAAAENKAIDKVVTWAAIHDIESHYGEYDDQWEKDGVKYIANSRTNQQMPLYYQLYEDIANNKDRFDLRKALINMDKPLLICHGDADPTVDYSAAEKLKSYHGNADVFIVEGGNHVFGGTHPYDGHDLPDHMLQVARKTMAFIKT